MSKAHFHTGNTKADRILPNSECVLTENTQLAFKTCLRWDIDSIASNFVEWMTSDTASPASISRVGILTSFKFQRILAGLLGKNLSISFRLLLETSSILYSQGDKVSYQGYSCGQLHLIQCAAGTRVLQMLHRALGKNILASFPMEKLKALFLILVGTIVAVGYSDKQVQAIDVRSEIVKYAIPS